MRKLFSAATIAIALVSTPVLAEDGRIQHKEFRDILAGELAGKLTPDQIRKVVYYPDDKLMKAPESFKSAEDFLNQLTAAARTVDPVSMYEKGKQVPLRPRPESEILAALKSTGTNINDRPTIIVVPGIFGELIKTRAFEDVFSKPNTAYAREFAKNFANHKNPYNRTDAQFSLEQLSKRDVPLDKLISTASIDDKDGKPLVNLVLFNTEARDAAGNVTGADRDAGLSLESMGDVGDKAKIFLDRLHKFFAINGIPKNIVFVGYSRGTIVGLDMLSQAKNKPEEQAWMKNVKGMVSLGGVVYGSDLADDAVDLSKNSITARRLKAWDTLVSKLQEKPSALTHPLDSNRIRLANDVAYAEFAATMAATAKDDPKLKPGALRTDLSKMTLEAAGLVDLNDPMLLLANLATKNFKFAGLDPDLYNKNIRRMKALGQSISVGAKQLSQPERVKWWANHTIPTKGIRYYAVAGSMVDPKSKTPGASEVAGNKMTYNAEGLDYAMLLGNYRDYRELCGIQVNDSQVPVHKVRFWPEMAKSLNPGQAPFDSTFLGVMGVDHWGLALRVANELNEKKTTNLYSPFPREALLKALATTVVLDNVPVTKPLP